MIELAVRRLQEVYSMRIERASSINSAIMFAAQMQLVEHVNEEWRLHLGDLLDYFGRSGSMVLDTDANGNRSVTTELWGGKYSLKLMAVDKTLFEWDDDTGPTSLNIEVVRHRKHVSESLICKKISAEKYGSSFYCEELNMSIDARQLAQLIAILGGVEDNYADWRPQEQSS